MEKEANSRDRPARENYRQLMRHEPAGSAREPPEKPVCTEYPECEGCPYPGHGFVCWRERCMREKRNESRTEIQNCIIHQLCNSSKMFSARILRRLSPISRHSILQ